MTAAEGQTEKGNAKECADFLPTEFGRVISADLNRRAWILSTEALRNAMASRNRATALYLLVGAQGAAKTTWLRSNEERLGPDAVDFDAILVKRFERQPLLDILMAHSVPTIAVWLVTPLEICLLGGSADIAGAFLRKVEPLVARQRPRVWENDEAIGWSCHGTAIVSLPDKLSSHHGVKALPWLSEAVILMLAIHHILQAQDLKIRSRRFQRKGCQPK